jgi:diacylglycerol kinase family enzyme
VTPHVLREGEDAAAAARTAEADVLGIAGGDGSVASVAAVAVERDLPFVCVPFGTRNHFARDLGLDRGDPQAALAAFAGEERRVDVGRVNGHVFVNNVSLGLYAGLVHRREHHRRRGSALARLRAVGLLSREPHRLHLRVDGSPLAARVVLVSNNDYELDLFTLGARERLDGGRLCLYSAAGWLPRSWSTRTGSSFTVEPEEPGSLEAAADGEPLALHPPLRFEILPGALRVLLPLSSGAVPSS